MKKFIIITFCLIMCVGLGLGIFFAVRNYLPTAPTPVADSEPLAPEIFALNTISLFVGESKDVEAELQNFDGVISYSSSNPQIASVDENGKVLAKDEGLANILSKCQTENELITYTTVVHVYPNEVNLTAKLYKDNSEVNMVDVGELYTFKVETDVNLSLYSLTLLTSGDMICSNQEIESSIYTCEVYFTKIASHSLKLKMGLSSDISTKYFESAALIVETNLPIAPPPVVDLEPADPVDPDEDDPSIPDLDPDEPSVPDDTETVPKPYDPNEPSEPDIEHQPDKNPEESNPNPALPKITLTLAATDKHSTLEDNVLKINSATSSFVAMSVNISDSDIHTILASVIEGNSVELIKEAGVLGFMVKSKGITKILITSDKNFEINLILTIEVI